MERLRYSPRTDTQGRGRRPAFTDGEILGALPGTLARVMNRLNKSIRHTGRTGPAALYERLRRLENEGRVERWGIGQAVVWCRMDEDPDIYQIADRTPREFR